MNEAVMRALLAPYRVGTPMPSGAVITFAGWTEDGTGVEVRLARPDVTLKLRPRSDAPAMCRTDHLDLWVDQDLADLSAPERSSVDAVVAAITANDRTPLAWTPVPPNLAATADADVAAVGGALVLVPGHLGNPLDLGLRAAAMVRRAGVLVVERGSEEALAQVAAVHGIDVASKRVVPIAHFEEDGPAIWDAVRAGLDAGETVALFGVEGGIPAFGDPGSDVITMVRRERPDVPVWSVPGPSVLGTALMRVDEHLESVLYVSGMAHDDPEVASTRVDRVVAHIAENAGRNRWLAAFGSGHHVVTALDRLATRHPGLDADVAVCADLSRPTEHYVRARLRRGSCAGLDALAPDADIVLFVRAYHRATSPTGWWPRLKAWWAPPPEEIRGADRARQRLADRAGRKLSGRRDDA